MLLLDPAVPAAVAETRLLHHTPPGEPGWLVVARMTDRWREKAYRVDAAAQVMGTLEGSPDTYVSQATFVRPQRQALLAQTLRCAFLDLDLYNVGMPADDATVQAILRHAQAVGIPQPSLVMGSGRGIYAKWVFDTPITSTLMPQWRALQATLIDIFRQFGVDKKVRDAARVLRVASSLNTKSDTRVRVLTDSGRTVSFAQMCEQVGQVAIPQLEEAGGGGEAGRAEVPCRRTRQARVAKLLGAPEASDLGHLEHFSAQREPILMRQFTERSLNWARFLDMRDLAIARGGFARGSRDIFLFSMLTCLAHSGIVTPQNFDAEVRQLLRAFPNAQDFKPTEDGSLKTLRERIARAHKGQHVSFRGSLMSPIYTPSNDYLLDVLQVTPDEEMRLRTIISGQERQRRADLKVPGRAERRQAREEGRAAAQQLAAAGSSASEIASALGKSRATVYRWLAQDKETPAPASQAATAGEPAQAGRVEMRGRRSPYAQRKQSLPTGVRSALPPVRKADIPLQPGATDAAAGQAALAEHELLRRVRPGTALGPRMTPEQAQNWVAQRLDQIRQSTHEQEQRRRVAQQALATAAQAETEQAKLQLQMRLARLMAHTRNALQEAAPSTAGAGPAARGQPCAPPPKVAPADAGDASSHLWPAAARALALQREQLAQARARSAQRIERMRQALSTSDAKELS